eukprot:TRINITY_DN12509_c0_g1_i2.p1 TRINITY_DN12509_c0_g1~~TRINITY_DN12509_c0_g1_i2.p1  ORF type:complete len:159 (+),score=54.85 TRINITY_DN12509_c0_g1_i2:207-683(+)
MPRQEIIEVVRSANERQPAQISKASSSDKEIQTDKEVQTEGDQLTAVPSPKIGKKLKSQQQSQSVADLTPARVKEQKKMFESSERSSVYRQQLREFRENVEPKKLLPTIQMFESTNLSKPSKPPSLPPVNSNKMKELIKNFEVKTLRKSVEGIKPVRN